MEERIWKLFNFARFPYQIKKYQNSLDLPADGDTSCQRRSTRQGTIAVGWNRRRCAEHNLRHGARRQGRPALPLMTLLRESPELICNSWKISGFVMLRNMALADGDPANMEKPVEVDARIRQLATRSTSRPARPRHRRAKSPGGKGTNRRSPPLPPSLGGMGRCGLRP